MLPFKIKINQNTPASDQIVAAVKRALVSGQLRPGDSFPSVREMSKALRINPKTAQKSAALIAEGILETRPGLGSRISESWEFQKTSKQALLDNMIQQLVVESKMCGLSSQELADAIQRIWEELDNG